jgi:hypothetical protein
LGNRRSTKNVQVVFFQKSVSSKQIYVIKVYRNAVFLERKTQISK